MKTTFHIALLALLATLSGACQNQAPDELPGKELIYREFIATRTDLTKTTLDGSSVLWDTDGETISLIDIDGSTYPMTQNSVSADRRTATFAGGVPYGILDCAVYPSDCFGSYNEGRVVVNIPTRQAATPNSFASGAAPGIAKYYDNEPLHFRNVCGLIGFTVNAAGIKSIRFSAKEADGGSLTGPVLVDYTGSDPVCSSAATQNSVSYVEITGNIQSGTTYWAVVAPGTYSNLEVVFTDNQDRTATFTKSATLTVTRNKQVNISAFNISKWDSTGEEPFTLVTDDAFLNAGDELLIVYQSGSKALGAISSNGRYRLPADVTISGDNIASPGEAAVLTLEEGSTSGTWALKDGSNYLSSASSGNNLENSTQINKNSSWTVSINSSGAATIKAQAGASTIIQYNTSSPRFSCYGGGQAAVAIYSRSGSGGGTPAMRVSVTTGQATSVTTISATLSGSWSGANATVREAGFQIGTSSSSLDDVYQADITPGTSGSFSVNLDLLDPDITYYYRAYVILQNDAEIKEFTGQVSSFTTSVQPDVPAAGVRPGWAELPAMNITKSGKYMINSDDNTQYFAWHICPDFYYGNSTHLARNYTVCYSSTYHCPVWVAAPRHRSYEVGSGRSSFGKDPDIPADIQYQSKDTGGGCNKGHMLGSAERTCTDATNKQVFYYTNIAPQLSSGFNTGGGGWNTLEDKVDGYVCSDTLYVVIGCYFDKFTDGYGYTVNPSTISFGGRDDVHMPTMFYYVLLRTKSGTSGKKVVNCSADELQCVAFVRSHTNSLKGQKVSTKELMSVSDLEQITGVTYFANVPNAPKNSYNPDDWDL